MKKIALSIATVVAALTFASCGAMSDNETSTCTVVDKSAVSKSEGGTDYRVYTEDCGTFQVADSLTRGTFSSSDTYGRIKVGETYVFTHHGYRNGFLSMFPNITEVQPVESE